MNALGRLILVLALIALVIIGAVLAQGPAGTVALTWGNVFLEASVPVALGVALVALVLAYYAGQLMFWLGGLPGVYRLRKGQREHLATLDVLEGALIAQQLGLQSVAERKLAEVKPQPAEKNLHGTLRLLLGQMSAAELREVATEQTNSRRSALADLQLAQLAAGNGEWRGVRDHATLGLEQVPGSPRLLALRLKALLNLDELGEAREMLPELKPLLQDSAYTQLVQLLDIQGGSDTGAVAVQGPWTVAFRQWLLTADDRLPGAVEDTATPASPRRMTGGDAATR